MSDAKDMNKSFLQFTIPMNDASEVLHIGQDDLPWLEMAVSSVLSMPDQF